MKIVLQRVKRASVLSEGGKKSAIEKGFLLLVGVAAGDTEETAEKLAAKIGKLRVFEDENGKMNLDIRQVKGEILSVSEFTLLGDLAGGNRPSFDAAAKPDGAKKVWEHFNLSLEKEGIAVKRGEFGAKMEVSLANDGPVAFILEN